MGKFVVVADTDIGNIKETNQDSLIVKHAMSSAGEIVMAIVCDGMGGLSKGELASATVIREFSKWFDHELSNELDTLDMNIIARKWELMLKDLNLKILEYGKKIHVSLGTTFTGVLFIQNEFIVVHIGDTRLYHLDSSLKQLTEDQTFINRELKRGNMSLEEAKKDSRRNMLLQCVGASKSIEPQIIMGQVENGTYLICSDGFRHEVTQEEIYEKLQPNRQIDKLAMKENVRSLIDLIKQRNERDNISAILLKVEG